MLSCYAYLPEQTELSPRHVRDAARNLCFPIHEVVEALE